MLLGGLAGCIPEDGDGAGEALALPTVTIDDATLDEGDRGVTEVTLVATLEGASYTNAAVDYRLVPGTARPGEDYLDTLDVGTLFFTPTTRQQSLVVSVLGDSFAEDEESFTVELFNPRNLVIAKATGTVSLANDDDPDDIYGIPDGGYATPATYPGMDLLWADEFDADALDPERWSYEIGTGNNGWGNAEEQYYRRENTALFDGHLVIEARDDGFSGSEYTSSRIVTMDKREFRYGRVDIRAALPEGQGLWPALWMLGANIDRVGWPRCGEIDIMELTGDDTRRVLGTAHYGDSPQGRQFQGGAKLLPRGESYADAFHVFSLVWEEDRLRWFVDDEQYFELTPADVNGGAGPWPFNNPFFMVFNVAVGGTLPGAPDASTTFPQRMFVDYIRVFQ